MTKDFAKNTNKERGTKERNSRKSAGNEGSPSSVKPFITGTFFGVFLCLAVQWLILQNQQSQPTNPIADSTKTESITGPVLDFYETLKEVEVVVPEEALVTETENVQYLLQAGSFREAKDADSLRAQLILLNLDAEIRKFNRNGVIWHRVIVGPFIDRSVLSKTRTTLLENGIESLLLTQSIKD